MLDLSLKLMADNAKKTNAFLNESPCHCGAVKDSSDTECEDCQHQRGEVMQDKLETARRAEQK